MSSDPRAALAAFVTALERHLEAASSRRSENDPVVVAAYQDLAEAFDRYDDALMEAFGEVTPLEIYSGDDEDDEEFDEEFDDEDTGTPYLGLDEEEFDEDATDGDADESDAADLDDESDDDESDDDESDDDESDDEDEELTPVGLDSQLDPSADPAGPQQTR
ncbi:MAG TPA: hypothetical protein VES01_06075 [Dermatophilaceae bacterium]|nr:hypothetical protein [Dermatophilaceae bacterium]